ncbi:transporter substrate-binding domain-containing protein [Lacticaseibacillus mingshuiensis]|uniref:Transporter substrate-binding domain-containing protein n=1 Tax=Lacticaseibacillus mingshuiensis TaxID=2799574 RepID=A0ABW4CK36_9LACO|nr:transporter substrate-binding domain-containing protein [Lacticaseibacillus mingshuiensis]
MKKTIIRTLASVAGLAVIALGLAACGSSSSSSSKGDTVDSELVSKGKLTVGLEGTYAPYSYRANGKLTGFEVDLSKAIAKKLGLTADFKPTKWDSLIQGVGSGRFDISLNNITETPERAKAYSFSTPYVYSRYVLITKKGNKDITKIADIKGKKTADATGSDNEALAKKFGATVVPSQEFTTSLQLVKDGRADATINAVSAWSTYAKTEDTSAWTATEIPSSDVPAAKIAALLNKKSTALTKAVNKAIKELREDGTLTKLSKQYFNADITEDK